MLYKKWLFVPSKEKYLSDTAALNADVLIYDLEDSIREDDKEKARERLVRKLKQPQAAEVYIRINSGTLGLEDLKRLKECRFDGCVIPKTESADGLRPYLPYLEGKKILALVESIAGIMRLEEIAASPAVDAIAFGGEDFCRELGVSTNDLAMQYARGRVVYISRFYQKVCLDTISLEYRDTEKFLQQFRDSVSMGFHSKLLIHPAQAAAIQKLEDGIDPDELKKIVQTFESSADGLVQINGRWYEKPHIERIRETIKLMEARNARREQQEKTN